MPTFKPTLAQQDLILAFQDQLSLYGHVLSSGTNSFPCLMSPANPAEPEFVMEMFRDAREVSIATVLNTDLPGWVVAQQKLSDESGQQWTTINRVNNPSDISVQLWLQKITDQDT